MKQYKLSIICMVALLFGCTDAQVASRNLSTASDQFEIVRRIIFYNSIQDVYMLSIEGRCSISKDKQDQQLEVTCKLGHDRFKKHFLGVSDNVTYFVEQLESQNISTQHYKVIFKPSVIIPDIDIE